MKRKKIIGVTLAVMGAILVNITLFVKIGEYQEYNDMLLSLAGSAFLLIGAYFLYKAKKEQKEKEKQPPA